MSKLGIFVNRQTFSNADQLNALIRCRDVAEKLDNSVEFIFPVDMNKIKDLDALFIRSRTDPMNTTYIAARLSKFYNIPVLDDPDSIQICSDKINMYSHLMKNNVALPKTEFLSKNNITLDKISDLFYKFGSPLILKEPSTSFSVRVEKVSTAEEFFQVSKRFIKLSDWIVVQQYIESTYDWRIGTLNGEFLYACKYIIPSESFKIHAQINGHIVYCGVESVIAEQVPKDVIQLGLDASHAIGNGLYGVDIKHNGNNLYVIEVNDNPSIESGEDNYYPDVFSHIINYLLR
jgi:glutathione synthase/RimK-type ligase-like ATP-grasp enzyme